jgi:hypothetical protein
MFSCSKEEDVQPEDTTATPISSSASTTVYISSAVATPTLSESFTFKNNSGSIADIGGWSLGDINDPIAYSIPVNTTMQIGATLTFNHTTLGFQINDSGEILYLKNGGTTVDTWSN